MTDEAATLLGKAILKSMARFPPDAFSDIWEILLSELNDEEFDRFMELTGRKPPFAIKKAEGVKYFHDDDIPF